MIRYLIASAILILHGCVSYSPSGRVTVPISINVSIVPAIEPTQRP